MILAPLRHEIVDIMYLKTYIKGIILCKNYHIKLIQPNYIYEASSCSFTHTKFGYLVYLCPFFSGLMRLQDTAKEKNLVSGSANAPYACPNDSSINEKAIKAKLMVLLIAENVSLKRTSYGRDGYDELVVVQ